MSHDADLPFDLPENPGVSWNPFSSAPPRDAAASHFIDPFGDTKTLLPEKLESVPGIIIPGQTPFAYELRRIIAEGGQGEVWRALQVSLSRTVAVKRIRRSAYSGSDESTARLLENSFYKEALVTSRLDHPAIVPVYDLGHDPQGRPLLAMKLVEGTEWGTLISRTRKELDPPEFLARHLPILISVCHAVAFAHSRGVVHRDLKPAQVMVGEYGEVFLMDWGLAVVLGTHDPSETAPTMPAPGLGTLYANPAGTICFMAPEQTEAGGARIGPWTDVFLLGGILYLLLTGTPPWDQADSAQAFDAARKNSVEPPESRAPEMFLPADLVALCMQALARDIAARPAGAEKFRAGLEQYLNGTSHRKEAVRILEEIKAGAAGGWPISYSELSRLDREIAHARSLWPAHPEAELLNRQLTAHYADTAFARRDLGLARIFAGRIEDSEERQRRLAAIEAEQRRMRRIARQRRSALVTCFCLIAALGALSVLFIRNQALARAGQHQQLAENRKARAEAERVAEEEEKARRQAATYRSLTQLHAAETELSRQFEEEWSSELPVPPLLARSPHEDELWNARDPERLEELLSGFRSSRQVRFKLSSEGMVAGPVPYALQFGAATTLLYSPAQDRLQEAYDHFAQAAAGRPDRYRAQIGMAAAALRLGDYTSASLLIRSAARDAAEISGFRGDYGRILALESEVDRRRWANFALPPGAVLIEPRAGGSHFDRYRELSGNWEPSDKPANWAKSSAPGTTPLPGWGSRKLLFHSSFVDVETTFPAIVRWYPRAPAPARYYVYVTWPRAANASPVRYAIRHRGGETVLPVAQDGWGFRSDGNSNRWVSLGAYEFEPGEEHCLELRIDSDVRPYTLLWNGQAQADAAVFSPEPLKEGVIAPAPWEPGRGVRWLTSFQEAQQESLSSGRPIFVFSAPAGHPETHHLDAYVFSDPVVQQALADSCIPLRILATGNTAASWQLRSSENEWTWICDCDGRRLRRNSLAETLSTATLSSILTELELKGGRRNVRK